MNLSRAIIVFDLGTTFFKGTLFDVEGNLLALARVPTPFTNNRAPHSEVAVPKFDAALDALAAGLRQQAPDAYAATCAVTFSSQTNTFALLDADNEPLTPFVVWNDRRAVDSGPLLARLQALPEFYATTGVPGLSPEFMVAKLHWFQQQTPELWERVARITLISDYFTSRFTGQFTTETGAAGLTGLVDIHAADWWDAALNTAELDRDALPAIARAGTCLGAITLDASTRFGLPLDCQFVVGCLDQYAGALGAGNCTPGDVSETTGTVLATVRCASTFSPELGSPVFWGPAAEPGRYYQMVFGDVSGNLLEAYRNALPEPIDYDTLSQAAARAEDRLLLLSRTMDTPEMLAQVRGWARNESQGEAVRAILEGVAAALAEQVAQLCGAEPPVELRSVGGAARSAVWLEIKANTLGVPVRAVACPEPTSLGAALLALHGLDGTPLSELAARCVQLTPQI